MFQTSRPRIQLLPPALCNQIAAGEVIERPASAVKELVENSIDAEARSITVELEDGGRQLIRITDDGIGMVPEDAELALQRHATSKIRTVEDLSAILTLGFRGEALPSIASVSKMTLTTQPKDALVGTRIEVDGGRIVSIREAAAAPGTCIEIRNLFFNTPARLKFLKQVPTELRRVQASLQQLALVNHDIHIKLIHGGTKRFDVPPNLELGDRLLAILGRETYDSLFPLPSLPTVAGCTIRGYFGAPSLHSRGNASQFTFVNGRFVKDRTISAAISTAYRELMHKGQTPVVGLMLEVPPAFVDVNVHPTKIEVRFQDNDVIFRTVFRALREGLAKAPWTGQSPQTPTRKATWSFDVPTDEDEPTTTDPTEDLRTVDTPVQRKLAGLYNNESAPDWVTRLMQTARATDDSAPDGPTVTLPARLRDVGPPGEAYFSRLVYIGQFAKSYLIANDGGGLVIIDQHAAHERITFERLKSSWRHRTPEAQQLLFPVQLELDALRAAIVEEFHAFFEEVGFDIEPFGHNTFAIKAVPGILSGAKTDRVLRDAIDDLSNSDRSTRLEEAKESVLSRMACHGSVRAGDHLTPDEAYALFTQMDTIDFRGHCPHGRPVYFKLPIEELEKRFDRR
ncbi:MAG: hypothetical protein AUK47_29040 [Deltaproteobacteria bacterium CG2_30_63_29]|nr:MAG: hypothetical protein AUK47_29040 [Deltaproteobacteria bacterium CG2_30_63_29]PIW00870.1 MAG: DNA mismatch repair protein MutL [Deltaproteobacteria bacterium CG17_big_fil_post_rev_8_21_14_2_50_63_7]PJB45612.1 MAG: DNA mismatch repair protein MutL [Deltaproteobacteria bacterium CG_4_9_14_3_um_filter_63_12]